ncbi:MAG: response regulator transcription factor [Campylobacterota bacterium]|nr:response regulator transcription factor [Campylobacterota bacterium]
MSCTRLLKHLTVLCVEDEKTLAYLLKEVIGDKFYKFELAEDGEAGLQKSRELNPDIVITDITMPKMNGLKMAEAIRENNPATPIVVLSAYSKKEKFLNAIDIGIVKYFIKPFDPDELLDFLCSLAKKLDSAKVVKLIGPYSFNIKSEQLFKRWILVRLSKREAAFIANLLHNPNYFMSYANIKERLWPGIEISDERLRTFIKRLRQKTDKELVQNLSGQGYSLSVQ